MAIKIFRQPVQLRFPKMSIVFDPGRRFLERTGIQLTAPQATVSLLFQQSGPLQHAQVL